MPKYVVGVRFNKSAIQNKTKTKVKSLRIKEEYKQPKPNKELVEGSIVKNIDYCEDIASTVIAIVGTPVLEYSDEKDLGWLPYNSSTAITANTKDCQLYADTAYFDVIGFDVEYNWYYATKPDLSDSIRINHTSSDGKKAIISDIENAPFVYCVATSTDNDNVVEIKSNVIKIIGNSFKTLDDLSFFDNKYLYTDRTDVSSDFDIFTLKDGFSYFVLPSYVSGDTMSYGTGSMVYIYFHGKPIYNFTEIMLGDTSCDGVVDVIDAAMLNKAVLGGEELSDDSILAADINMNGDYDELDYQAVINKILAK